MGGRDNRFDNASTTPRWGAASPRSHVSRSPGSTTARDSPTRTGSIPRSGTRPRPRTKRGWTTHSQVTEHLIVHQTGITPIRKPGAATAAPEYPEYPGELRRIRALWGLWADCGGIIVERRGNAAGAGRDNGRYANKTHAAGGHPAGGGGDAVRRPNLYAVAQWGRERVEDGPAALISLGLPPGRSPSVATLYRVFKALGVAAFEAALGRWLAASGVAAGEALALDGKTLRGIHGEAVPGVHLVAAFAHRSGAVLAQAPSPGKGQELAAAKAVLGQVPLAGRAVTGDALLTQRDLCLQIVAGKGDDLFPVDENRPVRLAACEAAFPPWAPRGPAWLAEELARLGGGLTAVARVEPKVRHGRRGTRMMWALADPALNACARETGEHGTPWPHLRQVCRVRRQRVDVRTGEVEDQPSYAVTRLGPERAAARLLRLLRGHWGVENRRHRVRDVTYDEDRSQICQICSGTASQAVVACRNLAIALRRRAGAVNIAAATRTYGGRALQAIALVAAAGQQMMK